MGEAAAEATVHPAQPRGDKAAEAAEKHNAKGAAALEAFARDHDGLTDENEMDALDHLLAPRPPSYYDVRVDFETEDGSKTLTFIVRGMDGRRLDTIETANRDETTGQLDQISTDCQIIAEACAGLEGRAGHVVRLNSEEFLTVTQRSPVSGEPEQVKLVSPAMALEQRFTRQSGLLLGVAREVRGLSGFDMSKVKSARRRASGMDAQQRQVSAAGNSSSAEG